MNRSYKYANQLILHERWEEFVSTVSVNTVWSEMCFDN